MYRPWTTSFQFENWLKKRREYIPIEPIKNWSFFRGDRVCSLYIYYILYKNLYII